MQNLNFLIIYHINYYIKKMNPRPSTDFQKYIKIDLIKIINKWT